MEPTRPLILIALTHAILLAGGDRAQAQGGSWADVANMPTPRRLLAAAAEGGNLYTFGGCGSPCFGPPFHTSTKEETTVEVYLPQENRWVEKKRMPTILFGAAAAPGNGKIYTFGGYVSGNVVQEYDPEDNSWRIKRPMPTPRFGLAAVALGDRIYVLGGSGPSGALEIYDPATDTWSRGAPMPTPRVFLAAAAVGGKIHAIGGSPDCCGNSQTEAVEIYDPATNRWETGPPLPGARQVSAAAEIDGKIYVFGGFVPGSGVLSDTLVYDPQTRRWTFGTPLPVAKDQAPAVLIGSRVFIPGGSVDCHCRALARTDRFEEDDPRLECKKHRMGSGSVAAGEIVTYTIRVENPGPVPVAGVTLDDPAPEGMVFVPDATQPCGAGFPCDLGTLAPGGSRSVNAKFRVNAAVSCDGPGTQITNVATVSASGVDLECPASAVFVPAPPCEDGHLECTKTGPSLAKAGDLLTYSVEVTNTGSRAVSNVVLSDQTPAGLKFVEASCGTLPCQIGTLAPGESRQVELNYRVDPGCSDRASVVNVARVSGKDVPDDTCQMETSLLPEADLGIELSAPESVAGEAMFDLEVMINNAGPATARNATMSLNLQGATAPPGCGTDAREPGAIICALGDVACGGGQARTFRIQAPACAGCNQPAITADAEVTSATPDPNPLNNSDSALVQVDCPHPSIELLCQGIEGTFAEGGLITYTFVLANCGPADQMDNPGDEFTNTLPAGLTLVSAAATSGTTFQVGNTVTWNGVVPAGGAVTITIQATLGPGTAGTTICNQATASFDGEILLSDDPHTPGGPDPCCFTVPGDEILPIPTLSDLAAVALALLLATLSLRRLRRPSAGR